MEGYLGNFRGGNIASVSNGDHAFSSAAPREWNRLPTKIRAIKTLVVVVVAAAAAPDPCIECHFILRTHGGGWTSALRPN